MFSRALASLSQVASRSLCSHFDIIAILFMPTTPGMLLISMMATMERPRYKPSSSHSATSFSRGITSFIDTRSEATAIIYSIRTTKNKTRDTPHHGNVTATSPKSIPSTWYPSHSVRMLSISIQNCGCHFSVMFMIFTSSYGLSVFG